MLKFSTFIVIILFLVSAPLAADDKTILIDPGHGGYDTGIVYNRLKEKDLTLFIARQLEANLRKENKSVYLTRNVDRHLSIANRVSYANKLSPGIFLSLHVSNSNSFAVYVSWYPENNLSVKEHYLLYSRQKAHLDQSKALAQSIEEAIKAEFDINVYHRETPLPILNSTGAPAVLIEMPSFKFTDYKDKDLRDRLTAAITNGVMSYGNK